MIINKGRLIEIDSPQPYPTHVFLQDVESLLHPQSSSEIKESKQL